MGPDSYRTLECFNQAPIEARALAVVVAYEEGNSKFLILCGLTASNNCKWAQAPSGQCSLKNLGYKVEGIA